MLENLIPRTADQTLPSDEERELLRTSLRGYLAEHWPAETAVVQATNAEARRKIWKGIADQGLAALCTDPTQGGVREVVVTMQELGRASCPAPLGDAALLNLLLQANLSDGKVAELLAHLHEGDAYPCFSFAATDAEPNSGSLTLNGGRVSGRLRFVEAADSATHFAVAVADGAALAIVGADGAGIRCTPTLAFGTQGLFEVEFVDAPAWTVSLSAGLLNDALRISQLVHAARAWGAADRSFELAVDYAKQRRQFGQPIGRFQAIQHKLANNLTALTGIALTADTAAEHFDRGASHWRRFAAATWAYSCASLRTVSLETHHAFGAIGYAEEHEAPRHFRRVHLDLARHGAAAGAREELAGHFLDDGGSFPEFDLGLAGNAFRREVHDWLANHWPPQRKHAYEATDKTHRDYDPAFAKELGQTGWLGLTWPSKFGGMERSAYELLAFLQEVESAEAPRAGSPIQAAAWMIYGTPEQQARYLPELLRGEVMYGMWYSEPDSGSDLASMRTTAVRDGDEWIINGQKIWTTTYWGDYMWLAARTDPAAKPSHAGISMFVVRTDTPGITRKPMRTMYDGEFCNTFFDDVRIPADALVGPLNGGWQVLTGSLGIERAYVGSRILMKLVRMFEELCAEVRSSTRGGKPLKDDPVVRDALGKLASRIEVGRQLALNSINLYARGQEPTWEAAMAKVFAGELMETLAERGVDLLGMSATLSAGMPGAAMAGSWEQKLRHSLMWVISLGTNEIQRSLIAQRGLGLPR